MRDYINRLSRGKSIIEVPKLICSEEQVTMNIVCGRVTQGNFAFSSSLETVGMVYADDDRVNILTKNFSGCEVTIDYEVDAEGLEENDEIEGNFTIVCNAGEKIIPFVFLCVSDNEKKDAARRTEEQVIINTSGDGLSISVGTESVKSEIELNKTGTENLVINVSSDVEFIQLERDSISTDDFTGDRYELGFIINPDKLHAGHNWGYVYLDTYRQHIKVAVCVDSKTQKKDEDYEVRYENKKAQMGLTKLYLDFRMKKIKKEKWIASSLQIIDRIRGINGAEPFYDLVQVQLFQLSGREEEARTMLDMLKRDIIGRIGDDVELYCYFLYVSTLVMKSDEYTAEVNRQVRKFFENGYDTYRVLWILFYLNTDTESNKSIRLIRIKDMVNDGCSSPIMYLEAINIINSQPVLLRVLNQFEIRVINFGCRYDIISEKLAMQIAAVAANEKNIDINMLIILRKLYEKFDKDEILTALVTHMVRLGMTGENCFPVYEKGILRGLRITRLYEFYIASMKKDIYTQLPKIVLMYFAYDNTLGDREKAFLYANIVRGRDSYYKDIFVNYEKNIEIFVYEQLKAGNISDELVVLYKALLGTELLNKETGEFISGLAYVYRVKIFSDVVRSVEVRHPQFKESTIYGLSDNQAYVYMYSTDADITFECTDGITRKDVIDYELERVFPEPEFNSLWEQCEEYGMDNAGIMISRVLDMRKKGIYTPSMLTLCKSLKKESSVSDDFKTDVNSWMISYYSGYYILDDFWHEYPSVDTDNLTKCDAGKLIETLISFSMYSQAYELTKEYGCCRASAAKLLKMADYILKNVSDMHDEVIDAVTSYIFSEHIYNEPVLVYMAEYFNGTNEEMYNVWKACISFGVNVKHLSDRLLAQMMYTGVHSGRFTEVFTDYYNKTPDMLIVKAYLSYNSQFYLIRQKKANDIVFRVIEEAIEDGYGLPECCYVAWMKNLSKNPIVLNDNPSLKKMAQEVLDELCEQDRIYSFYRKFDGILEMPYNIIGMTVIEYIANPDSKVTITYTLGDDEQKNSQVMKSNEWGIFTSRFNLFYGDRMEYFFTESGGGTDKVSEPAVLEYKEVSMDSVDGRFDAINDCLASRQLHDLTTLRKLMHSYSVEEYVTRQMFEIK